MKDFLVADRYARSLDTLTSDNDQAEAFAKSLSELARLYAESHELRNTLANPALVESRRLSILNEVCVRSGAPDLVRKIAATLLRRRRIALLPVVASLYSAKTDERLGRVRVGVTSAAPLPAGRQEAVTHALERYTRKNVRVEFAVDPSLLGGVVARIQDRILDGSIRSRIERLKNHLLPEENLGG